MNKNFMVLLVLFLGIVIGYFFAKIDISSILNKLPSSCTYNGQIYKDGEGFMNDCNSCSCQNGQVACTLMACGNEL